ncbi:Rv3654c family TadE-like protein [Streptomyces cathayae]|uniref:Rv3654c family TadE-like protein n=1 Tax=Streptomyces cathayae TaxID=3031124 RepID=UPI003C6EC2EE
MRRGGLCNHSHSHSPRRRRRWPDGRLPAGVLGGVRGRGRDRGSATVWSVGVIAVLCVVFGVVLVLGQAAVVRHRAAGGADLAALAAADRWRDGEAAACARADRVARAQNTRLVRCAVDGEVSDVSVASGREPFAAEIRARAGPAGPPPPPAVPPPAPGPPPAAP